MWIFSSVPFAIAFSFDMIQNPFYIISASIKLIAWMDMMINVLSQRKKKKDAIIKNAFCVQFNCHRIKYDKYNFF